MENVLTYMTFVPVAGAAIVLALPNNAKLIRWISAAATVPPLLMAIWLFKNFDRAKAGFQFIEDYTWIPSYNISYTMGIDGLSISMVLLTALLSFLCIFALFGSVLMLLAILALYFSSDPHTFDMRLIMAQGNKFSTEVLPIWPFHQLRWGFQHVVWMALFIGFAIKIPAFPFHTWLPDA